MHVPWTKHVKLCYLSSRSRKATAVPIHRSWSSWGLSRFVITKLCTNPGAEGCCCLQDSLNSVKRLKCSFSAHSFTHQAKQCLSDIFQKQRHHRWAQSEWQLNGRICIKYHRKYINWVPGRRGSNFESESFKPFFTNWYLDHFLRPLVLVIGECYRTPLINNHHWFRQWLVNDSVPMLTQIYVTILGDWSTMS